MQCLNCTNWCGSGIQLPCAFHWHELRRRTVGVLRFLIRHALEVLRDSRLLHVLCHHILQIQHCHLVLVRQPLGYPIGCRQGVSIDEHVDWRHRRHLRLQRLQRPSCIYRRDVFGSRPSLLRIALRILIGCWLRLRCRRFLATLGPQTRGLSFFLGLDTSFFSRLSLTFFSLENRCPCLEHVGL